MSESEKAHGIEALKKAVDVLASGAEAFDGAFADGKIGLEDVGGFVGVLVSAGALIPEVANIPKEFADLDEEEKAELNAHAVAALDLSDEKAEVVVERIFKIVVELGDLVHDLVSDDAA